jgi:hypothetical protein
MQDLSNFPPQQLRAIINGGRTENGKGIIERRGFVCFNLERGLWIVNFSLLGFVVLAE